MVINVKFNVRLSHLGCQCTAVCFFASLCMNSADVGVVGVSIVSCGEPNDTCIASGE